MGLSLKSLVFRENVLKIPILIFAFIIMLISQYGGDKGSRNGDNYLGWVDPVLLDGGSELVTATNFCDMVGFGYVYILMVQIISIAFGERWPVMNLIFSFFGIFFYLALGSLRIKNSTEVNEEIKLALGGMAIINGLMYMADTVLAFMHLRDGNR